MTEPVTCGVALMRLLKAYGVDTVFGMPGVHTLELYRDLARIGIRHIGVRHEQGAGFMADGYARVSGRPGVCLVISGPGVTNAATPMGQAYADSVPMLVVSSVAERRDLGMGRGRLHEISAQDAVTGPLTAFSAIALDPEEVPELVARAFAVFTSQRPRPVHISIPLDVITAPASFAPVPRQGAAGPAPNAAAVRRAADLLIKAKRPVVVVGGGAARHGSLVRRLAEKLGAAVVPTIAAKGVVPDGHPLVLESTLEREATQGFVAAADVVLVVGSELAEPDLWAPEGKLRLEGAMIRVDIDAAVLLRDYAPEVAIQGDAGATLAELVRLIEPSNAAGPGFAGTDAIARARAAARADLTALERKHLHVLGALREALPPDGFVMTDMSQIVYTGYGFFPCSRPQTYMFPVGYGTLGFALPAAIGAKLAQPERQGVALAGDGGLLFTVQELATAVEHRLPLAVVLWNNDALAQIRDGFVKRGIAPVSTSPHNPDFLMLAQAFGCRAVRAASLDHFKGELTAAFAADAPTLIEVREDAPFLA
ncbi:MAG: 5-guanidino-2-oxopentanoate decarboxylase [Alphaproteobacteria bacterium]